MTTPPTPTCCELACYEDPGCTCDGCHPDPAPLDVERLARALHDCRMVVVAHGKFTDKCICNDIARFIVREYAKEPQP